MRARPYTIIAVSTCIALGAVLFAAACDTYKEWIDPDLVHFDAAIDYGLAPQVTHIGPSAVTCCVEALGTGAVFYLANPQPGGNDPRTGRPHPPFGELHLANAYGADYVLAAKANAFGYTFAPDGQTAFYLTSVADGTYALNAIRITLPALPQPTPKVVIPSGMDDPPLGSQGFFTPTGAYFVAFPHPPGSMSTNDLHVVSVVGAEDILQFKNGGGTGAEQVTFNDVLIYEADSAPRNIGEPNVEGLYLMNLQSGITGGKPFLIDQRTNTPQLTADATTLVYLRNNQDMVLWDLKDQDFTVLAHGVISYSLGPGRRGPFVWVQNDLSVHVAYKQRPEFVTLPAGTIDAFSPLIFSSDRQHLYYFKNVNSLSSYGDLYHVALPPTGNGQPNLISVRASMGDLYFSNERLLYLRNIGTSGDTGDLISVNFDGSDPQPMAPGVATGEVQLAYPLPYQPPQMKPGGFYPNSKAPDLSLMAVPPVLANLTNAARDTAANLRFVNTSARPLLGALAYGPELGKPELVLNPKVHAGQYQFSDDGYVLLYVGDAVYQASAFNYVGKLQLFQTNNNIGPTVPMLDGVAEIGPIVQRGFFASAPGATTPGVYFVKY